MSRGMRVKWLLQSGQLIICLQGVARREWREPGEMGGIKGAGQMVRYTRECINYKRTCRGNAGDK